STPWTSSKNATAASENTPRRGMGAQTDQLIRAPPSARRIPNAATPIIATIQLKMKILVVDIGGTNIKVASSDKRVPVKIPSGPKMTAEQMTKDVLAATKGWGCDCISIGYPGPVVNHRPIAEPHNLAPGWIDFPYQKAFGKPLRFINDAAMQALGGYKGG